MSVKTSWVALLCGMALFVPVAAQDEPPKEPAPAETKAPSPEAKPADKSLEDPPLHRWGGWTVSLAAWNPALLSADEEIATINSGFVVQPLTEGGTARAKETVRVAYHLPKDLGSIFVQYDAMESHDDYQNFQPGQFMFGESRAFPYLTGAFDDGLADGVSSSTLRRTREFRLEYQRRAFESKWARGTWGAGYRELSHERALGITYYAIVPNLPPIIPPVIGGSDDPTRLNPLPDQVGQTSGFTGHGLGASLDVEFTLHPRVSLVSGLSIGVVRGTASSTFTSANSFYYLVSAPGVPLTSQELIDILTNPAPPGSVDHPQISDIQQTYGAIQLVSSAKSQMSESIDVYFGVQVLVYKGIRIFATLRDVSYTNVGQYVVPTRFGTNETTNLNVGYEGYTVGVSWRF